MTPDSGLSNVFVDELHDYVAVDPEILGGLPLLKGTDFPLTDLFAELRNGLSLGQIADEYDLDVDSLEGLFDEIAELLNAGPARTPPVASRSNAAEWMRYEEDIVEYYLPELFRWLDAGQPPAHGYFSTEVGRFIATIAEEAKNRSKIE